jgi:hypothetical protein
MSTRHTIAALFLCTLGASGCAANRGYKVSWLSSEMIPKRLDAHWFMREVHDEKGLSAVELLYCPSLPQQPTICRTSVVWERDARSVLDNPRLSPARK